MKKFTTLGDGVAALKLEECSVPVPGPNEVLVRMTAAALNYRDLLVINGTGNWKPNESRIPVSDGAGVVVAVGGGVLHFSVGDRVVGIFLPKWLDGELTPEKYVSPLGGAAADGVLLEYRIFDKQALVNVPDYLSDMEAATLPVAAITAWHAVKRRSRIKRGEFVLIQGTGGVSLFALQFAHALGARPIVISSSDEKLEKARLLGATHFINYKKIPVWEEEVLRLTSGSGVHHVIEVVGGGHLNRSLQVVKMGGTISFIGLMAGLSAPINTYEFVTKNVQIHGIETGSREMFEEMIRFMKSHRLKPVIDKTFSFLELPKALTYLENGSHFGKVVIVF